MVVEVAVRVWLVGVARRACFRGLSWRRSNLLPSSPRPLDAGCGGSWRLPGGEVKSPERLCREHTGVTHEHDRLHQAGTRLRAQGARGRAQRYRRATALRAAEWEPFDRVVPVAHDAGRRPDHQRASPEATDDLERGVGEADGPAPGGVWGGAAGRRR